MKILTSSRRVAGVAAGGIAAAALVAAAGPAVAAAPPKPTPSPTIPPAARLSPPALPGSLTPAAPSPQLRRLALQNGAPRNGVCNVGEVCLYYLHSPIFGSLYDAVHNDPNLFDNQFISPGLGHGAVVGNNAEFVWNRDPRISVRVCTGLNNTGICGVVLPNQSGNFTPTFKNRVQSFSWLDS